jgi:hypothetical protein
MIEDPPKLDIQVLRNVEGTQLFYPASARDYLLPIQMFAPYIRDFWFVDIAYFGCFDPLGNEPSLSLDRGYKLLELRVKDNLVTDEQWKNDPKYPDGPPRIRTEEYYDLNSKQRMQVHFYRRRGCTALRQGINKLGVFFYRRDSNEGGSSTKWLGKHMNDILEKIIDGGLLVTDGSNCEWTNTYTPLRRFHGGKDFGAKTVEMARPFTDKVGNKFQCIGYAGEGYGPTLVWQVHKAGSKR